MCCTSMPGTTIMSVMADLKAWWPQLKPGGVLIGDDYFKKPLIGQGKWPEVRQAFDEFFAATPHTVFENGDGKCYVGKAALKRLRLGLARRPRRIQPHLEPVHRPMQMRAGGAAGLRRSGRCNWPRLTASPAFTSRLL